jgi:hypothetical protein
VSRTTSIADRDRQAVYDAEDVAFGGTAYDEPMPFADAADLATAFCAAGWWTALELPVPAVVATRTDSDQSYTRLSAQPSVHLSPAGCTVATIAHELAHVVAHRSAGGGEPHHGPAFRRADVTVVGELLGAAAADRLAAAFAAAGLDLGPDPVAAGTAPAAPAGFWATWRSARALAAAEPAARGPIAL